ncbi:hypothetical protein HPB50_012846 [Hyalomma asiaticum]|uniref:Uncharacterized protein n=1 Tax=Hyalomma asiaticum TaxID=266040 RepID=A0ACB7SM53_HYAAI|nr:hypothetical protein HPB50_012846 [Hyalomma asiaticum]
MVRAPPPGVKQGLVGEAVWSPGRSGRRLGPCARADSGATVPLHRDDCDWLLLYAGEAVYRAGQKLVGRDITPHRLRSLISKKGNYHGYFFRRSCQKFGTDVVSEEISDDNKALPLWEGKILAMVEPID